jgi:hypothetical protein
MPRSDRFVAALTDANQITLSFSGASLTDHATLRFLGLDAKIPSVQSALT